MAAEEAREPRGRIEVAPIGWVRCARAAPEDDGWLGVPARIELDPARFTPDASRGLAEFSHVEVLFHLDQVPPEAIEHGARRPRERADLPEVGIFAQRARARPNRIGLSRCRVLAVRGLTLDVEGLDAIDGTPVLDIKPWFDELGPIGPTRQPAWTRELMRGYY